MVGLIFIISAQADQETATGHISNLIISGDS